MKDSQYIFKDIGQSIKILVEDMQVSLSLKKRKEKKNKYKIDLSPILHQTETDMQFSIMPLYLFPDMTIQVTHHEQFGVAEPSPLGMTALSSSDPGNYLRNTHALPILSTWTKHFTFNVFYTIQCSRLKAEMVCCMKCVLYSAHM